MKMLKRGMATFAVAVAAAVAAPEAADAQRGTLEFRATQSQSEQTPFDATGGTGSIDFTGSLETPTPCYEVSGAHAVRGSRVILTVTATQTGDFCTQVITYNNYEGAVQGLASGTYTFEIVHRTGSGRGETVYTTQVTVE
jgi:hypothetical protein